MIRKKRTPGSSTEMTPKAQQVFDRLSRLLDVDPTAEPSWADLAEEVQPLGWDWPGWLPRGFLTIVASQAGAGKSSLCLRLAACYIDGRAWPDGAPFTAAPGKVLWVESEGGHRLNLQRVQNWGMDPSRIVTPNRNPRQNFTLSGPSDTADLLLSAQRDDVQLIILDSLGGLSAGATGPRALRSLLTKLAGIAHNLGKAMVLTHHLRKRTTFDDQPNLDRLLGSSVVSQIPRLIWALDLPDAADPDHRRLSVIKNNLAPFPAPLGFRIDDFGLHFGPPPQLDYSQLHHARNFLTELLADGPLPAAEVLTAAQAAGIALPTLKRAKKQLRIQSSKQPRRWLWRLPS